MRFKKITETIEVIDIADKGQAIGKTENGKVVFVDGLVPGDIAEVTIFKKKKGSFLASVNKLIKNSPFRSEPFCSHFGNCGGCKWQNLNYQKQLEYKEKNVKDALLKIAKTETEEILPIEGAELTEFYRNKLEFSFSNKRWLTKEEIENDDFVEQGNALGFHAPGNFEKIIQVEKCFLQKYPSNEIRDFVRELTKEHSFTYYDVKNHNGLMRNMIIRTSNSGEVMVTISFSEFDKEKIDLLLGSLKNKFPEITSLNYVINSKFNDSIWDLEVVNYSGSKFIRENLGSIDFIISPKSFFQTNTYQSQKLYDIAVDFAGFKGDEHVLDLYTGIGSIALYIADKVKSVVGIEVVNEAIEDAKDNAKLNNISNVEFIAGDVKKVLNEGFKKPDIIIVDPPRAGLDREVTETIMLLSPIKIVYISCNPSTQARDIQILKEEYQVKKSKAVDMFPHTHHIENIVLLIRKD
ncbi:MAG: 23S rRNA (uracil(1939)-C(5))-methyltransferase RlmD [Saprospiraceae bacterium]|nr:23S rRNA (uracil(1939)-C(5))-methyltransferase RlmD [Saprospiraceae bacterium]